MLSLYDRKKLVYIASDNNIKVFRDETDNQIIGKIEKFYRSKGIIIPEQIALLIESTSSLLKRSIFPISDIICQARQGKIGEGMHGVIYTHGGRIIRLEEPTVLKGVNVKYEPIIRGDTFIVDRGYNEILLSAYISTQFYARCGNIPYVKGYFRCENDPPERTYMMIEKIDTNLKKYKESKYSQDVVHNILFQVAFTLKLLATEQINHYDLKPDNVMLKQVPKEYDYFHYRDGEKDY